MLGNRPNICNKKKNYYFCFLSANVANTKTNKEKHTKQTKTGCTCRPDRQTDRQTTKQTNRQTDENNELWHAAKSGSPFDLVAE